uniref:Uncharacterized protein n=1 Tax=Amphimedon queenslandica TaxID=400682 RepID=A0A1X7UAR8_AMPQE
MATKRDIARLLNEEIETDYEAVEDIEEEKEEGKEEEKETKIVMKILIHHCLILRWLWTYKYQILI